MKYLIFGNGFFASKFRSFLGDSSISDLRIDGEVSLVGEIERHNPDIVINCVGKAGTPNIDWCETHRSETFHANVTVPSLLATACEKTGKRLVHLSSGCIYSGDHGGKGFSEQDAPNFEGSFYSRTKILAERALREFGALQLRIRIPFDDFPHPRNVLTKLLNFDRVVVVQNSMTYVPDFLRAAKELMDKGAEGIFNVTCQGAMTYREVLDQYHELRGTSPSHAEITPMELDRLCVAQRSNCLLDTGKLEGFVQVNSVVTTMRNCLQLYIKNEGQQVIK